MSVHPNRRRSMIQTLPCNFLRDLGATGSASPADRRNGAGTRLVSPSRNASSHFETKRPCRARVLRWSLAPLAADRRPECVSLKPSLSSGRLHLLFLVRSTRALQDCSDRVLAEPDMAADQPVAQTSLCQLEDLRRFAVRWTLSWLAAEPLTAGLGGGDAGLDALADT